jgi:hypothetical protein
MIDVLGQSRIALSLLTVFIATFTLFYIFDSLEKLANECSKGEHLPVCESLTGFTFPMIVLLLIIGGFVIIISAVFYILLSAPR